MHVFYGNTEIVGQLANFSLISEHSISHTHNLKYLVVDRNLIFILHYNMVRQSVIIFSTNRSEFNPRSCHLEEADFTQRLYSNFVSI